MPEMDGIEATRRLPRQRVLILTTFGLDDYIIAALRAGASGFLLKDAPTAEVVDAVRAVAAGDAVLSPGGHPPAARPGRPPAARAGRAGARSARPAHRARARGAAACSPPASRTPRSPRALVLSEATVKTHVSNLLGKLGLRDRVQAVIYAYETRLIEPADR